MAPLLTDRRKNLRSSAAYPATLLDRRGRPLSRGRTANISERGALLLVRARDKFRPESRVIVELLIPLPSADGRRLEHRKVVYKCRIAHVEPMGQMAAIGIELLEKLR